MKRGLLGWLIGIFLLGALVLLVTFNVTKPRVLVLHSGGRHNGWDQRIDEGMRAVLSKNRRPVAVHWHYMNMGELPLEAERQDAAAQARRAIQLIRPHLLLVVDDEAQGYVARRYAVPTGSAQADDPAVRIVYAAIDGQPSDYAYDASGNVTGVLERLPLAALRETLLLMRDGKPARIAVIGPLDPTGKAQMQQVQEFDWGPHELVRSLALPDFNAWQVAIPTLADQADVLIVLSFDGLQAKAGVGKPLTVAQMAGWIEAHAKPLPIGVDMGYVQGGGGLAIGPSPTELGEVSMRLSLEWLGALDSGFPAPPPSEAGQHYRVAARESALRARQVVLPSIYLEAARQARLAFP